MTVFPNAISEGLVGGIRGFGERCKLRAFKFISPICLALLPPLVLHGLFKVLDQAWDGSHSIPSATVPTLKNLGEHFKNLNNGVATICIVMTQ
jgi:hypothetical protein